MLEIVIAICFKKEDWLLIIDPDKGGTSSGFRAGVRNSIGKNSLHTGNRSQGLV